MRIRHKDRCLKKPFVLWPRRCNKCGDHHYLTHMYRYRTYGKGGGEGGYWVLIPIYLCQSCAPTEEKATQYYRQYGL